VNPATQNGAEDFSALREVRPPLEIEPEID